MDPRDQHPTPPLPPPNAAACLIFTHAASRRINVRSLRHTFVAAPTMTGPLLCSGTSADSLTRPVGPHPAGPLPCVCCCLLACDQGFAAVVPIQEEWSGCYKRVSPSQASRLLSLPEEPPSRQVGWYHIPASRPEDKAPRCNPPPICPCVPFSACLLASIAFIASLLPYLLACPARPLPFPVSARPSVHPSIHLPTHSLLVTTHSMSTHKALVRPACRSSHHPTARPTPLMLPAPNPPPPHPSPSLSPPRSAARRSSDAPEPRPRPGRDLDGLSARGRGPGPGGARHVKRALPQPRPLLLPGPSKSMPCFLYEPFSRRPALCSSASSSPAYSSPFGLPVRHWHAHVTHLHACSHATPAHAGLLVVTGSHVFLLRF